MILCGNRPEHVSGQPEYHDHVEAVRACYAGTLFDCDVHVPVDPANPDGRVHECGADAWLLPENEGGDMNAFWRCSRGHDQTSENTPGELVDEVKI